MYKYGSETDQSSLVPQQPTTAGCAHRQSPIPVFVFAERNNDGWFGCGTQDVWVVLGKSLRWVQLMSIILL